MPEMLAGAAGGNPAVGLRHLAESYTVFAGLVDDWPRGVTINLLAVVAKTGNYPSALALLDAGLRLARLARNLRATVQALQAAAGLPGCGRRRQKRHGANKNSRFP